VLLPRRELPLTSPTLVQRRAFELLVATIPLTIA